MAQYARSRVLRNPTTGTVVRHFRRSKSRVGGGRDRGLGGKMVLLGPARVLAVEQPTDVESPVAAVVWLAHGRWPFATVPKATFSIAMAVMDKFGRWNEEKWVVSCLVVCMWISTKAVLCDGCRRDPPLDIQRFLGIIVESVSCELKNLFGNMIGSRRPTLLVDRKRLFGGTGL